jgi:hypothetical protein
MKCLGMTVIVEETSIHQDDSEGIRGMKMTGETSWNEGDC